MTNQSTDWSTARLDDAIARIVDERGDGNDWRIVVAYGNRFGNDVVMKAAQDAALKLRKSRVTTYGTSCPATIPLASRLRPLTTHDIVGRKPIA